MLNDLLVIDERDVDLSSTIESFERKEYDDCMYNMGNLLQTEREVDIKVLKVPFCTNIYSIQLDQLDQKILISSYSAVHAAKALYRGTMCNNMPQPVWKTTFHNHGYYEIAYILQGNYTHQIEDKRYTYSQGSIIFLGTDVYHKECCDKNCTIIFFCLSKEKMQQVLSHLKKPDLFQAFTEKVYVFNAAGEPSRRYLEQIIEQIVKESIGRHIGSDLIIDGLICRMMSMLLEPGLYHLDKQEIHPSSQNKFFLFKRLQEFLWIRGGQANRKELIEKFNYCGDYLNRLLKENTGYTISKYNQEISLSLAKDRLKKTDEPITQILQELGFENKSFFYTLFYKKYGMTPNKYRERFTSELNIDEEPASLNIEPYCL